MFQSIGSWASLTICWGNSHSIAEAYKYPSVENQEDQRDIRWGIDVYQDESIIINE